MGPPLCGLLKTFDTFALREWFQRTCSISTAVYASVKTKIWEGFLDIAVIVGAGVVVQQGQIGVEEESFQIMVVIAYVLLSDHSWLQVVALFNSRVCGQVPLCAPLLRNAHSQIGYPWSVGRGKKSSDCHSFKLVYHWELWSDKLRNLTCRLRLGRLHPCSGLWCCFSFIDLR